MAFGFIFNCNVNRRGDEDHIYPSLEFSSFLFTPHPQQFLTTSIARCDQVILSVVSCYHLSCSETSWKILLTVSTTLRDRRSGYPICASLPSSLLLVSFFKESFNSLNDLEKRHDQVTLSVAALPLPLLLVSFLQRD